MKLRTLFCLSFICLFASQTVVAGSDYERATDDPDNVKRKLFPKKGKVELNLPDFGLILNQPLITTFLVHGGITYYASEEWGYGVELSMGLNSDKNERECLELFYNDPNHQVEEESGCEGGTTDGQQSNYGPAYMPIREINYIIAGNLVWNPIYGKQLLMMSSTGYFDVFFTLGGGIVMSNYYEQLNTLNNGKESRATYDKTTGTLDGGASESETDSYGEAGRPPVQQQTHPFINLGIGQKYHFFNRFSIKFEFRNMTLLGTPGGFENLFAIWTGLGIRF